MQALYHEVSPATGVEHAFWCYFTTSKYKQLVTIGANQITVYRVVKKKYSLFGDVEEEKEKLLFISQFTLFGRVMSACVVNRPDCKRDALLLTFEPAKAVIVEYNFSTCDLRPLQMMDYDDALTTDCFTISPLIPEARIDPEMRCAVYLAHSTKLLVVPLRKDSLEDISRTKLETFSIDLHKLDESVANVLDMQFLHGYFEPTLLILYQPIQTFSGRLAMRKDTVSMVTISMNIIQRSFPIIWSQSGLPFDCFKAIPIPKPIGGVLIVGANCLIFFNQSIPAFGVSLNSICASATDFPLKSFDEQKIALDCSRHCLIDSDKLAFCLKGGEIYVITLLADEMNMVKGFDFQKSAASVLTCCICTIDNDLIFLGSRLGNSLLLKYFDNQVNGKSPGQEADAEPPQKKKRLNTAADWIDAAEDDDLEIFGSARVSKCTSELKSFSFEVCDSLMQAGPISKLSISETLSTSEELQSDEIDAQLVAACGHAKNGAVSIFQRTVKPEIISTFDSLRGYNDLFTVGVLEDENGFINHGYMFLSKDDKTTVLETGQEFNQLSDKSEFEFKESTVLASSLTNHNILQVTSNAIIILEKEKRISYYPLSLGSPVVWASLCDPYILLVTSTGEASVGTLVENRFKLLVSNYEQQQGKVVGGSLYKDISGIFSTNPSVVEDDKRGHVEPNIKEAVVEEDTLIDDDELLYSDKIEPSIFKTPKISTSASGEHSSSESSVLTLEINSPSFWLFLARESGSIEIRALPSMKIAYYIKDFCLCESVYNESNVFVKSEADTPKESNYPIYEILVRALGPAMCKPYIFSIIDDELVIYEVLPAIVPQHDGFLQIRLVKYHHEVILQQWLAERKPKRRVTRLDTSVDNNDSFVQMILAKKPARLRPFTNINTYSGVFVCGDHPVFAFVTLQGFLRFHYLWVDGAIHSFAPFNNMNCPSGFLYFNKNDDLRVAALSKQIGYETSLLSRKVSLRATVAFIVYHLKTKNFAIVLSSKEPVNRVPKVVDEKVCSELLEKEENYIFPNWDKFSLQIASPLTFEMVHTEQVEIEDWEHVTSCKSVQLVDVEQKSGLQEYVAVGTSTVYGEEMMVKGKLLLYDISEIVPETDQPAKKFKYKLVCDAEAKGPITAINSVEGYMVSAHGQKIFIHTFQNQSFVPCAFIDANLFTLSILTLKSFVLTVDVSKSITIHRFDPRTKGFYVVSRDIRHVDSMAANFLVDNTALGFIVSDDVCNLTLLTHQPELKESQGGQRLVRRGDFNTGSRINHFVSMKGSHAYLTTDDVKKMQLAKRKHTSYFGTLDGAVGYVVPIQEKLFRRLNLLQSYMVSHLQHSAGLNPKAFRKPKCRFTAISNSAKPLIDGDLIFRFLHLSHAQRAELSRKILIEPATIINDLIEIHHSTMHF